MPKYLVNLTRPHWAEVEVEAVNEQEAALKGVQTPKHLLDWFEAGLIEVEFVEALFDEVE